MESKLRSLVHDNLMPLMALAVMVKFIFFKLTLVDCVSGFVVLALINIPKVVDHLFPKRPDVHTELGVLREQVSQLKDKQDELSRITTGIQLHGAKRS